MNIWDILGIVAILCLLISFGIGKNAIWGALTLAVIVGLAICIFRGFEWLFYKKVLIIGVLAGAFFEFAYRLTIWLRKKMYLNTAKRDIDKRIREELNDKYGL